MEELWIPIVSVVGLTIILCLFFWFRYRTRGDMQATIRTAIEKGQELSPEAIDRLGNPKRSQDKDLRLALLWIALALGMAVFGILIPDSDDEAQQVFLGMGAFPFFIGLAYLIMWRFTDKSS